MTAALITVFYPTDAVAEGVKNIALQTDMVYICDNSPTDNGGLFQDAAQNIRYIWFGENLGISAAFNRVLKNPEILWKSEDSVIFFDQDSQISQEHIASLQSVYDKLLHNGHSIGCLAPVFYNTSSGKVELPRQKKAILPDTYAVSSVITSSMLCRYGDLQAIGFWNEEVFLDLADWDLCWRMQASGRLCCMTEALVFQHSIGSGEKQIGPVRLRVGKPLREYYQMRDCLHLLWKSYTPIRYRIRFLAMMFIRSPLHLLFLDNRKERAAYIGKGIADYIRGKRGALDAQRKIAAGPHT